MAEAAFQQVWQKIAGLEGEVFHTAGGVPFTYRFCKTYVVVSAGELSIPRTFFQKVFQRSKQAPAGPAPALQGQTYLLAILSDPRLSLD